MFKIKSIGAKTPFIIGNYFRYTQHTSSGVEVYKLTAMSDDKITFAWWDGKDQRVQFAKNWCTMDEFRGHLAKGHYIIIPECQVEFEALKHFTHATDKI